MRPAPGMPKGGIPNGGMPKGGAPNGPVANGGGIPGNLGGNMPGDINGGKDPIGGGCCIKLGGAETEPGDCWGTTAADADLVFSSVDFSFSLVSLDGDGDDVEEAIAGLAEETTC